MFISVVVIELSVICLNTGPEDREASSSCPLLKCHWTLCLED